LFPNPSNGTAYLHYKANGDVIIQVYDMQGKLLQSHTKGIQSGGNSIELKIEKSGAYLIRLLNGKESQTLKWLVN